MASGEFTATNNISNAQRLDPGDSVTYVLSVQGIEEFIGTVRIEKSVLPTESFETVVSYTGTVAVPLTSTIVSSSYKNDTNHPEYVRAKCTFLDVPNSSDPVLWDVSPVSTAAQLGLHFEKGKILNDRGEAVASFYETGVSFPGKATASTGVVTKCSTDNVHDTTPTEASIITAFGAAATVGAGFVGIINDAAGGVNVYICFSTGAKWAWLKGAVAV